MQTYFAFVRILSIRKLCCPIVWARASTHHSEVNVKNGSKEFQRIQVQRMEGKGSKTTSNRAVNNQLRRIEQL